MSLELFVSENPETDRLCIDGCVLGNITHFEAWCRLGDPVNTRYDVVGVFPEPKPDFVQQAPPQKDTHPLLIRFGPRADQVKVWYQNHLLPLLTEITVFEQVEPRTRLIRLTALTMSDELKKGLTQLTGVELIIDHEARRNHEGIEESTHT